MKKNIVYVVNKEYSPSGYYRLVQYFDKRDNTIIRSKLNNREYHFWFSLNSKKKKLFAPPFYLLYYFRCFFFLLSDLLRYSGGTIVVTKEFLPHYLAWPFSGLIKQLSKKYKIIWDFDDNILECKSISRKEFTLLSHYSSHIVVTNVFLKNLISDDYRYKAILLPTTDKELDESFSYNMIEERKTTFDKELRLVWIGTSINLCHIEKIVPNLDRSSELYWEKYKKTTRLLVICDKPLLHKVSYLKIENIRWTRNHAKKVMSTAHIGLMPLSENEFTKGKGGFKLVQYIAYGLPVVASKVGFNTEIVSNDCGILIENNDTKGWGDAIMQIASSKDTFEKMSKSSRAHFESHFSYTTNLKVWDSIIGTV